MSAINREVERIVKKLAGALASVGLGCCGPAACCVSMQGWRMSLPPPAKQQPLPAQAAR
jgi:hypothetical protein